MDHGVDYLPRTDGETLAYRARPGRGPPVVWLGGFRSDMTGTKAQALDDWAARRDQAFVRFDYFGHGASSGAFEQGTISRWREDALAVIDRLTEEPAVLVGSSMGGWLACLAAAVRQERVAAMVLIAPAPDFTEALIKPALPPEAIKALAEHGVWTVSPEFGGGDTYRLTRGLMEDGARWPVLPGPVPIGCPVRILQGGQDASVPWPHALELAQAIESQDVVFTLIKDGDHRLSRPQDIERLLTTLDELTA